MNYQIVSSLDECVLDEMEVCCDDCPAPATKTLSYQQANNSDRWTVGWYCDTHYLHWLNSEH